MYNMYFSGEKFINFEYKDSKLSFNKWSKC